MQEGQGRRDTVAAMGRSARENGKGRDALIRAARALLVERGPGYVTLTGVARRAGLNPALVSYHFGSKMKLFAAAMVAVLQGWIPRFMTVVENDRPVLERLRKRLDLLIDTRLEDPYVDGLMHEQMLLTADKAAGEAFSDYMRLSLRKNADLLAEGLASGELRQVDPFAANIVLLGMATYFASGRGLMEEFAGVRYTPQFISRFKREAASILLYGLAARPPEGRTPPPPAAP